MQQTSTVPRFNLNTFLKSATALATGLSMTFLVGCNSPESSSNEEASTDSSSEVTTAETIRIATEGAYAPFNATDKDGNLVGFDIDLVNALCDEMKADCNIVAQDWDGIIPGLKAGKYDAVIAGMSITPERQEQVDFSDPYFQNSLVFVAEKGASIDPSDKASLEKITLGTQRATIAAQWLDDNLPNTEAKLYDTIGDAFLDLEAGRIDAILSDTAPVVNWLSTGKSQYEIIGDEIDNDDSFGIAVRKEDPLKDKFNEALAAVKENGKLEEIKGQYF